MLSKRYHWTVNLSSASVVVLVVCADRLPEWKTYFLAASAAAMLPALVAYFKRQWALTDES